MEYNHLILDVKLNQKNKIEDIKQKCKDITNILNLTILEEKKHVFNNGGFTLFFLLAESHISVHYRIEDDYLALDIYSCRNIKKYETQTIKIINKLGIKDIKITKLLRNI